METIVSNQWYEVKYDPENKLMEVVWHSNIVELSEEEYKKLLLDAYSLVPKYDVDKLLQNTAETVYPITPSLQKWITENITKKIFITSGLKRIAYLIPREFLTKIGIEQLIEQAYRETPNIIRQFFDSRDRALNWLLK